MRLEQRVCEMGGQGWAWTGPWSDGGPGTESGGIYICIHNRCKAQVQWNTVSDLKIVNYEDADAYRKRRMYTVVQSDLIGSRPGFAFWLRCVALGKLPISLWLRYGT